MANEVRKSGESWKPFQAPLVDRVLIPARIQPIQLGSSVWDASESCCNKLKVLAHAILGRIDVRRDDIVKDLEL